MRSLKTLEWHWMAVQGTLLCNLDGDQVGLNFHNDLYLNFLKSLGTVPAADYHTLHELWTSFPVLLDWNTGSKQFYCIKQLDVLIEVDVLLIDVIKINKMSINAKFGNVRMLEQNFQQSMRHEILEKFMLWIWM